MQQDEDPVAFLEAYVAASLERVEQRDKRTLMLRGRRLRAAEAAAPAGVLPAVARQMQTLRAHTDFVAAHDGRRPWPGPALDDLWDFEPEAEGWLGERLVARALRLELFDTGATMRASDLCALAEASLGYAAEASPTGMFWFDTIIPPRQPEMIDVLTGQRPEKQPREQPTAGVAGASVGPAQPDGG